MVDDSRRLGNDAMRVDVDGLDPFAIDHDLAPPPLSCRRCGAPQTTSDKCEARQRAGDQFPRNRHVHSSLMTYRPPTYYGPDLPGERWLREGKHPRLADRSARKYQSDRRADQR